MSPEHSIPSQCHCESIALFCARAPEGVSRFPARVCPPQRCPPGYEAAPHANVLWHFDGCTDLDALSSVSLPVLPSQSPLISLQRLLTFIYHHRIYRTGIDHLRVKHRTWPRRLNHGQRGSWYLVWPARPSAVLTVSGVTGHSPRLMRLSPLISLARCIRIKFTSITGSTGW